MKKQDDEIIYDLLFQASKLITIEMGNKLTLKDEINRYISSLIDSNIFSTFSEHCEVSPGVYKIGFIRYTIEEIPLDIFINKVIRKPNSYSIYIQKEGETAFKTKNDVFLNN